MLESGSSGSVRGASSNGRPYREPRSRPVEPTERVLRPRNEPREMPASLARRDLSRTVLAPDLPTRRHPSPSARPLTGE
jgi:hypothetical protein